MIPVLDRNAAQILVERAALSLEGSGDAWFGPMEFQFSVLGSYNSKAMSSLFDDIQKQAQMLTLQEKATLAHMLITEIDSSGDGDVEQMWIAESQRRYQAYLKGEVEAVPGDEALSMARNRLT